MSEPIDDRYATFREHAELRERTATVEANLMQIGPTLARIEAAVRAPVQQTPPVDHYALAIQRVMDRMEGSKTSQTSPIILALVILAVGVGAFIVGKVFF